MKEHEHATKNKIEAKPAQDEVARKAYAIYLKQDRPQGHAEQNWLEAEAQMPRAGADHTDHHDHHAHMAADFRKRFWISLALTLPILVFSPLLQKLVGLQEAIRFPGDLYVLFGFSSAVFWYGGWPFLKGLYKELKSLQPGMMTLVAVAITTAYLYSSAVVFGLAGKMFFWELATLVDVMLLGHWIEMKSVMGASRALEELAKLMPSDAHKLMPDGSVKDVPLSQLAVDDKVLIKPGEKAPADGVIVEGESSVNEAMLTGESTPVTKQTGGKVIGGSINGEGSLTIDALKALDIRCMMLTGDNKATAKWVSDQVGLDEYFAEVLAQDKAAKVKEVQSRGVLVAMTGDGVNDAPALAQADVGITIGAGSNVAVETVDVILVRSNPLDVVAIVQLSRATYRKMIQNLVWATGYNIVAIPLAAGAIYAWGVLLSPAVGAGLMAASTVVVAINARLLRLKKSPGTQEGEEASEEPKQSENRKKQYQQPLTKEYDHERDKICDQRPHLWNDRGRSNRDPRRTRWKDVLLLRRKLSAKVSFHARRCQAGGQVWILLWMMPALLLRQIMRNW